MGSARAYSNELVVNLLFLVVVWVCRGMMTYGASWVRSFISPRWDGGGKVVGCGALLHARADMWREEGVGRGEWLTADTT